jgi:hypothetical protein
MLIRKQRTSGTKLNGGRYVRKPIPTHLSGFFAGGPDLAAYQIPLKLAVNLHRT